MVIKGLQYNYEFGGVRVVITEFLNIKLLPWQYEVASNLFNGRQKYLVLPPNLGRGSGKTYLAAALALSFVCWLEIDNAKVIVIDPICRFDDYLYTFINRSGIKEFIMGSPREGKIWVDQLENERFILFLNLEQPENLMGFSGNLLFILDSNGKTYPEWTWEIIKASVAPENCFVYRT